MVYIFAPMKLVIFDLDGTLINTIEDLGAATNAALSSFGFPAHAMDEYYGMVGHGIRKLVINALPEADRTDDALVDRLLKVFVEYYTAHIDVRTRPYNGIPELLSSLYSRGYAIGVASNKFQAGAETLVKKFFPDIKFAGILGDRPGAPLKPSPEIVFTLMDNAGMDRNDVSGNVVMAGDSATDIKTAAAAGIPSIAVTWGFRPESDLTAADHVAHTAAELDALIGKILG